MEYEDDSDTNCNWHTWSGFQKLGKSAGRVKNRRTYRDHLDYGIVEIAQNTKKSPGDLRRFVVTQTPVKEHLLTQV